MLKHLRLFFTMVAWAGLAACSSADDAAAPNGSYGGAPSSLDVELAQDALFDAEGPALLYLHGGGFYLKRLGSDAPAARFELLGDGTLPFGDKASVLGDGTLPFGDGTLPFGDKVSASGDRALPFGYMVLADELLPFDLIETRRNGSSGLTVKVTWQSAGAVRFFELLFSGIVETSGT